MDEGEIFQLEGKTKRLRTIHLFSDSILLTKPKKIGDSSKEATFCHFIPLKGSRVVDHSDNIDFSNGFEIKGETLSYFLSSSHSEEKRQWLGKIKSILKAFQKQEFSAKKDSLIRGMRSSPICIRSHIYDFYADAELREKRRVQLADLSRKEVNPQPGNNQDVWSLALILWHMHTKQPLFPNLSLAQASVAFMTHTLPPELEDSIPPELREILSDCWLEDADARPNFSLIYDRILALDVSGGSRTLR